MKLIRSLGFRRVKTFEKFGHPFLCDHNIIHERGRSIQKRDLFVFTFSENIRELTIKFFRLLKFGLCNSTSNPLFQRGNTLGIFFLTVYVPIKVSRISLCDHTVRSKSLALTFLFCMKFKQADCILCSKLFLPKYLVF